MLASAAGPAVAFLLIPILTRVLTPGTGYGTLGLLTATTGILGAVVGLNPNLMVTARFPLLSAKGLKDLISAGLSITICMAIGAWLLLELLAHTGHNFGLPPLGPYLL